MQSLNDAAFSEHLTPEGLWRASASWAASGSEDQAEWLHEMAVELIDIHELPEAPEQLSSEQQFAQSFAESVKAELLAQQARAYAAQQDDDIPF